jgi:cell division protein FtsQ
MKDFILPRPDSIKPAQQTKQPQKGVGQPFILRYFFLVSTILLCLKIAYHLPEQFSSPPDTLNIQGNLVLTSDSIRQYLNLNEQQSWFSLDPYLMSIQLRKHPWIEKALVHRSPPLTVDVHITERVPIAFLKTAKKLFLLGEDYLVLKKFHSSGSWDLPIIVNRSLRNIAPGDKLQPTELKRAFSLMATLKDNRILPLGAISEIHITDPFNIVLVTSPNGLRIIMGFENFEKKLASLSHIMPEISENQTRIKYIDLRNIRGVVVKYK